jgi:CBS domain-containing protein
MRVSHVMIRDVETCDPDDNLAAAASRMWDCDIGCIPVVNIEGKVVGMLTDRDVCLSALKLGRPLQEIPVSVAMSRAVLSCAPNDSLAVAKQTMRAGQVRRLPVIDSDGGLAGIVSLSDLAREADREVGYKIRNLNAYEVNATLVAIGHPRRVPRQGVNERGTA